MSVGCCGRQAEMLKSSSVTEAKHHHHHSKSLRSSSSSSAAAAFTSSQTLLRAGSLPTSSTCSTSGVGGFTFDGLGAGDFQLDSLGGSGMDQLEMSELLDTLQSQDGGTAAAAAALMADLSDCMSLNPTDPSTGALDFAATGLVTGSVAETVVHLSSSSDAAGNNSSFDTALNGEYWVHNGLTKVCVYTIIRAVFMYNA